MSAAAEQLLNALIALPADDREAVMAELLRRCPAGGGDLPDGTFAELADDVFRLYDAAEAADAAPAG